MIGKVANGRGFAGLARYLQTGKEGTDPDRVEWVEGRNLPTSDPETAGLLMRATAARSDRIERPVYHIALSFDPDDPVGRTQMVQVADRLLKDLDLRDHQALIVAHGDTRHAHLHLMVNRVHPETFRAWDPKNDYARIERSLREQERELGLRPVPGHHYRLEGREPPDRAETLTTGQLRRWERTGEAPFDELVRSSAQRDLLDAASWKDLEERLGRRGLRIDVRGQGLVVTDGEESVKVSNVAPGVSRTSLEERFGAMYGEHEQQHGERRAPEGSARSTESNERGSSAVGRDAREASQPAGQPERNDGHDLSRAGRNGRPRHEQATPLDRRAPAADRDTHGRSAPAPGRAAARPDRDGAESGPYGRDAATSGRSGGVDANGRDRAGIGSRNAWRNGRGALDPRLDAVKRSITALERRIGLERSRDRTGEELDRARLRLAPLEAQRVEARQASERFRAGLAEVYRDPVAARREFHTRAQRDGVAAAAGEIGRHPKRFGELRGIPLGPVRSAERTAALRTAPKLERLGAEHLRKTRGAWASRADYRQARTTLAQLDRQLKTLNAELAQGQGSSQLRNRLGQALQTLPSPERRALRRALPIPYRRALTAAIAATQAFAREQGHER